MKMFKSYIIKWLNGEKIKGLNVSLLDIQECIEVFNGITRKEKPEFINGKVKEVLDKCNIKTIKNGIGWKIAY